MMADPRQRGVALLTALLVVALATMLAAAMAERLQLQIRWGQNLMAASQASQIAAGLEDWAIVNLRRDQRLSGSVDSRVEPWAQGLPLLPIDRGFVTGGLVDLDGRFNLNNLVVDGISRGRELERFKRLLLALQLDPLLAAAVSDWIDGDSIALPDGAEDTEYTRMSPPYRAANRALVHPSELRLIAGFDDQVYRTLLPHVATLPVGRHPTPINVNTATIPVLMSLHPNISTDMATRLWKEGLANYASVSEFFREPGLGALMMQELEAVVTVDSRYFLAQASVTVDEVSRRYFSVIEQGGRGYAVIHRSQGSY